MNPFPALSLAALAALSGCGRDGPAETTASPSAAVPTQVMQPATIDRTVQAWGTVEPGLQGQQTVSALAESVIEAVRVSKGQSVRRGDGLLTLRPSAASVRELEIARSDAAAAQAVLARTTAMLERHLATNADVANARQTAAAARATLASASRRIGSAGPRLLRAERDANIADVLVTQGDIVAADAPLLRLTGTESGWIRLGVAPEDAAGIAPGQPVTFTDVFSNQHAFTGRVATVARQVDPQSRLVQVQVTPDGATTPMPGTSVRASIRIETRTGVLVLPHTAIDYEAAATYAYVVESGKVRRIRVTLGIDDGQRVEIVRGLRPGQTVASDGISVLTDGMAVRPASVRGQHAQ